MKSYSNIHQKLKINSFPLRHYTFWFRLDSNENSFTKKLNDKEVIEHEKETYNNLKKSLSTRFYFRNFDKEAKRFILIILMMMFHMLKIMKRKKTLIL